MSVSERAGGRQEGSGSSRETFLHVLIGPPGAGKSTFARENFPAAYLVSFDDYREMLTGCRRDTPENWSVFDKESRLRVTRAIGSVLRARLIHQVPTVYDYLNIDTSMRKQLLNKVVPPTQRVRYHVLDRPLAEKLSSRDWRTKRLVMKYHRLFQEELPSILSGDGSDRVDVEDRRSELAR